MGGWGYDHRGWGDGCGRRLGDGWETVGETVGRRSGRRSGGGRETVGRRSGDGWEAVGRRLRIDLGNRRSTFLHVKVGLAGAAGAGFGAILGSVLKFTIF